MRLVHHAVGLAATLFLATPAACVLTLTCIADVVENAQFGVMKTITARGPFATAAGGEGVVTITPFSDELSVRRFTTGPPFSVTYEYTATDATGAMANCSFTMAVNLVACVPPDDVCGEPHMQGLRGQIIDWSGIDGGWYSLVRDDDADLQVNVRLTAPLPEEYPHRQLITGFSVISEGTSLAIEVKNPYKIDTDGCSQGGWPCLANGGLLASVDGDYIDGLLHFTRNEYVANGISMSASNLPVECRQFGGDKIWARMYEEMLQGRRQLASEERFEDWILHYDNMAAADWCTQYIAQHDLADVQSTHAIFKIVTPTVTVRLNVGINFQGDGEKDFDGRVLPNMEFWQMDVGLDGISIENPSLSGLLGETARPVLDKNGREVMEGYDAFRGTVEDYRVSGPLGTDFALLNKQ